MPFPIYECSPELAPVYEPDLELGSKPPEVSTSGSLKVAAPTFELSVGPVMAKETVYESSACLVMGKKVISQFLFCSIEAMEILFELLPCPVTAKKTFAELSACPVMTIKTVANLFMLFIEVLPDLPGGHLPRQPH